MKRFNFRLLSLFGGSYLFMLFLNYQAAWFALPDFVFLSAFAVFFAAPAKSACLRYILLFALLMDTAAQVPLGFHALLYSLALMALLGLKRFWDGVSAAGRATLLLFSCLLWQVMRCLLLYFVTGIHAPQTWFWAILWQLLLWLPWQAFALRFLGWRHAHS